MWHLEVLKSWSRDISIIFISNKESVKLKSMLIQDSKHAFFYWKRAFTVQHIPPSRFCVKFRMSAWYRSEEYRIPWAAILFSENPRDHRLILIGWKEPFGGSGGRKGGKKSLPSLSPKKCTPNMGFKPPARAFFMNIYWNFDNLSG